MARRGPKPKKTEHYIDPVLFKEQLREYYKKGVFEHEIAEAVSKIAKGLSQSSNFVGYSYKDEMVGDAIVKMYTAVKNKKFNVDSEYNPFSYFTTIAFHAFINRIKKEKKHFDALNEYRSRFYEEEMAASSDANIYIKPEHHNGEDSSDE